MSNTSRTHRNQAENASEGTSETRRPTRDQIPDCVTALGPITLAGIVRSRAEVVELDSRTVAATIDLAGRTFLEDLSPEAQERRWGKQMLMSGNHAETLRRADLEAQKDAEEVREAARERDGRNALADAWREEQEAASKPRVYRSTTTSRSGPVN